MTRKRFRLFILAVLAVGLMIVAGGASAATGTTTLVSRHTNGTPGNGVSSRPVISADSRYIAFASAASNLVDGDSDGQTDVFVHDRMTGQTTLVSRHADGSNGSGAAPSISADGRVLISTAGALAVPKPGGGTLKMQDEDVAAFTPTATGANTSGTWALYLNGSAITGMGVEDVSAVAVDPPSGYIYVSLGNAFNVGGVSGDGKDIIVLKPVFGGFKVERVFRGPNNGFNLVIAGLERQ